MPPPTLTLNPQYAAWKSVRTYQGRQYTRPFVGICDTDIDEAQALVLAAENSTYPLLVGTEHPSDPDAFLTQVEAAPNGQSKKSWIFTATYSTPPLNGTTPGDPLARPPEIRWAGETETLSIFYDFSEPTSKAICNSAGEPFDQLPQRDFGFLTLTYTRNEHAPDFANIRDYMLVLNSLPFTIDGEVIPAGYALMMVTDCPKIIENGITYYRVTYFFRFRSPDSEGGPWTPIQLLDVGYCELNVGGGPGSSPLKPIPDFDGMPVRKPYPLDGAGAARDLPTDFPALLSFEYYTKKDFSVFHFT